MATLTLDRPERRNTIIPELIDDFDAALARAQDDPEVRVDPPARRRARVLRGLRHRLGRGDDGGAEADALGPDRRLRDDARFVDAYMPLWRSPKPVIAQVHGYCVGGGTDFALCSDLIVCAEDCRIGYPPARVWGSPTTAMWMYRLGLERTKRLLLTGDAIDGRRAVEWGLASEAVPAAELEDAALALAERVAQMPANQLHMMKLLVNQAFEQMGLHTTQLVGTLLDGAARHTPEGTAFTARGHGGRARRGGRPRRPVRRLRAGAADRVMVGVVLAGGAGRRLGGDKARRRASTAARCSTTRCTRCARAVGEAAVVAQGGDRPARAAARRRPVGRGRRAAPSARPASSTRCAARRAGRSSWSPATCRS